MKTKIWNYGMGAVLTPVVVVLGVTAAAGCVSVVLLLGIVEVTSNLGEKFLGDK